MTADKNILKTYRAISLFLSDECVYVSHTNTPKHINILYTLVPPLWVNISKGSAVITGPVVQSTTVRWPTERSISVFTDLIQCGLFKLAGQAEIRLYLLGIDFCLVKAARAKGERVGGVYGA